MSAETIGLEQQRNRKKQSGWEEGNSMSTGMPTSMAIDTFINKKILLSYMEITKLSSKGQIVIPQKIRDELEIKEGSVLAMEKVKDLVVIKKIDVELVDQIKRGLEDIKHGRIKEWKG